MRVAHPEQLPPFAEARDGRSVGLVVDIFSAAAISAGLPVEYIPIPFERMQAAFDEGRAEAMLPIAITPERRIRLDFTATLLMTGGSLFVRAPNTTPPGLADLAGRTVATPRTGPLAAYIQRTAPAVHLVVTDTYETSLAMLADAKVDAAALNRHAGAAIAERGWPGRIVLPATTFLELPFAAAVPKGQHADLLARFDAGLARIRADGTWDSIVAGRNAR